MEDTPQNHTPDKPLQVPSIDMLIEERRLLVEQGDNLLQQIVESQNDELQSIIDTLVEAHSDEELQSPMTIMMEHGKDVLPDSYYNALHGYVGTIERIGQIDTALADPSRGDGELASYVRGEARRTLKAYEGRLLRPGFYGQDDYRTIHAAYDTLDRIVNEPGTTEEKAEEYYDLVEQSREQLQDLHALDQGADVETAHDQAPRYDLAELERAYELNERYHRPYHGQMYPDEAIEMSLLPTHEWQVHLDDDQRAHLERYLKSLDATRELERVSIDGVELLPFETDETTIKDLLRDIPAIALENVDLIFRKKTALEIADDKETMGAAWVSLAGYGHNPAANRAEITVWVDPLARQLKKRLREMPKPTSPTEEEERTEWITERSLAYLQKTLTHEFGHAFHTKLPVSLLHDWEMAVDASDHDQAVTDYVEQIDIFEPHNSRVEEFADSFTLCRLQPRVLQERSQDHYVAMQALINSCRP